MKAVLVTGSSRGIGLAIAKYLANEYEIILHCRASVDQANLARDEIIDAGGKARVLQFDVSDRAAASAALLEDIEHNGAYYGVVCNAGIASDGAFPTLSDDDWDRVIQTNLDGFYNVLKPLVMPMIQTRKPARIVTLSSTSGIMGNRGQVNYSAAKAGIIGATKALAVELAKRKITVNCVAPGAISTEMMGQAPVDEILKVVPMKRLGEPDEVASLIQYLLSDNAGYITRQVISVNGGLV
jgi:3-oxoacyl-[acyl-carrier protein] reductase